MLRFVLLPCCARVTAWSGPSELEHVQIFFFSLGPKSYICFADCAKKKGEQQGLQLSAVWCFAQVVVFYYVSISSGVYDSFVS